MRQFLPDARAAPPTYSPLEADINHEILMRTTNEDVPLGAYEKRARFQSYHGHIHDIPKRIVLVSAWGSIGNVPPLKRVLVKLLLLTTPDDLYNYLHDGTWLGDRWFHPLDLPDPDQEGVELPPNSGTWDVHAMPLNFHPKDWNQTPSVDRTRVKIKRFDYFGPRLRRCGRDDGRLLPSVRLESREGLYGAGCRSLSVI